MSGLQESQKLESAQNVNRHTGINQENSTKRNQIKIGDRFGKLIIFRKMSKSPSPRYAKRFECICDCGKTSTPTQYHLLSGHSRSCGCVGGKTTHGMSRTKLYQVWFAMLKRCNDIKSSAYKYYGERGVRVCQKWLLFDVFYKDMGDRPSPKHTIDRINNNGNYCPENCRWVLLKQNCQNTSHSKKWVVNGKTFNSMRDAAKDFNVNSATVKKWCDGKRMGDKIIGKKENCYSFKKY